MPKTQVLAEARRLIDSGSAPNLLAALSVAALTSPEWRAAAEALLRLGIRRLRAEYPWGFPGRKPSLG
jgi:hypothetical protein